MKKLTKKQEKIKEFIGRTIKNEAKRKKLELIDMQELTSLSITTISSLYNGSKKVQIDTLIKVCDALGLEVVIQKKGVEK